MFDNTDTYVSAASISKCWQPEERCLWRQQDLKHFRGHVEVVEHFFQALRLNFQPNIIK